ncbi:hypothetical protein PsorP6_014588 [Peronosclerospora sorghi]|uniref:Uncharacterized protein n=1 Tax=Peronosclerospora sorghi TaxID=230839 RepID=A0ACC0VUZ1_9STRA|nr:hypothetical protein PsorP6_014588 [Peronosclerospora sorghi]
MASDEAEQWKQAVHSEIRSHVRNHTWDLVMRPLGAKVIGSKWVFARKYRREGAGRTECAFHSEITW